MAIRLSLLILLSAALVSTVFAEKCNHPEDSDRSCTSSCDCCGGSVCRPGREGQLQCCYGSGSISPDECFCCGDSADEICNSGYYACQDNCPLSNGHIQMTSSLHHPAPVKSAKKTPAKKSPAKKSPAKKSPAKKSPAKKSPAKKLVKKTAKKAVKKDVKELKSKKGKKASKKAKKGGKKGHHAGKSARKLTGPKKASQSPAPKELGEAIKRARKSSPSKLTDAPKPAPAPEVLAAIEKAQEKGKGETHKLSGKKSKGKKFSGPGKSKGKGKGKGKKSKGKKSVRGPRSLAAEVGSPEVKLPEIKTPTGKEVPPKEEAGPKDTPATPPIVKNPAFRRHFQE